MNPSTRIFMSVVAVQAKGIVESQRRILVAFEKWLEAQDEMRDVCMQTTGPRSHSLRGLQ
jgi:hypothetical protein